MSVFLFAQSRLVDVQNYAFSLKQYGAIFVDTHTQWWTLIDRFPNPAAIYIEMVSNLSEVLTLLQSIPHRDWTYFSFPPISLKIESKNLFDPLTSIEYAQQFPSVLGKMIYDYAKPVVNLIDTWYLPPTTEVEAVFLCADRIFVSLIYQQREDHYIPRIHEYTMNGRFVRSLTFQEDDPEIIGVISMHDQIYFVTCVGQLEFHSDGGEHIFTIEPHDVDLESHNITILPKLFSKKKVLIHNDKLYIFQPVLHETKDLLLSSLPSIDLGTSYSTVRYSNYRYYFLKEERFHFQIIFSIDEKGEDKRQEFTNENTGISTFEVVGHNLYILDHGSLFIDKDQIVKGNFTSLLYYPDKMITLQNEKDRQEVQIYEFP